ncbi:MAG: preprotein translocase subunit SecG [Kiritimatiellae bacterium]|nr:preprotein translocase subunit SecG [Kiritimatiellia bacterium]
MGIVRILLILVEVVTCLLLAGVILLQKSKGEGLGTAFGGGMSESLFGSRAGNVLTKITVTLALIFLANTAVLGILFAHQGSGSDSIMDRRAGPMPTAPIAAPAAEQASGTPTPATAPGAALLSDSAPVAAPAEAAVEAAPEAPVAEPAAP